LRILKNISDPNKSQQHALHLGATWVITKWLLNVFIMNLSLSPKLLLELQKIYLTIACPLSRWHHASQVMLEKGKGQFVENLCIIQLCEADLNFVLHTIWGHQLIRQALQFSALNDVQYALPGQTCNNAVLNKVLFLYLSRQTLSLGILTDYDATAAFDRVLANLSFITCQRVGLPRIAGYCMTHLLKQMSFHLITGLGKSVASYPNPADGLTGQGVLQGSSSAAPLFLLNSDVSLCTYNKLCTGASFQHPTNGISNYDNGVKYVVDTSQFLNHAGASLPLDPNDTTVSDESLGHADSKNSKIWGECVWMSSGNLNESKCFYYAFSPTLNCKKE
jgi:hypothetical protein